MRLLAPASLCLALLAACGPPPCNDPEVAVSAELSSDEVRSLPTVASGKTRLLDADFPDSHGEVKLKLTVTGAKSVTLGAATYTESLGGAAKEVEVTRAVRTTSGASVEVKPGETTAASGDTVRVTWRAKAYADLLLPAGAAHAGKVSVPWTAGCRSGTATVELTGSVKPATRATNLQVVTVEAVQPNPARGAKVKMTLRSLALTEGVNGLRNHKFVVGYWGENGNGVLGLGLLDSKNQNVALQSSGQPRTGINPTDTLGAYSSPQPNTTNAAYDFAGQSQVTGLLGAGKAVVIFSVDSYRDSAPSVSTTDVLAELVDLQ